ncbi:MAG: hypothetical protein LBL21_04230 [Rickettsiales bacterium]|nr:hypothetical protein [Rickettsiales bacterium]
MKKLLFAAVLLSACGGTNQETSTAEIVACGDQTASLAFSPDFESLKLGIGKKTFDMKRKVSASGMWFMTPDEKHEYRSKGKDVFISIDGIRLECE